LTKTIADHVQTDQLNGHGLEHIYGIVVAEPVVLQVQLSQLGQTGGGGETLEATGFDAVVTQDQLAYVAQLFARRQQHDSFGLNLAVAQIQSSQVGGQFAFSQGLYSHHTDSVCIQDQVRNLSNFELFKKLCPF